MKKRFIILNLIFILIMSTASANITGAAEAGQIVGRIEKVKICPENFVFKAKLDTGADHSSLDVSNIVEFKREGKKWVRFEVVDPGGKIIVLEKRLARYAKIKRINQTPVERPVIRLGICLGKYFKEAEFNLTDRRRSSALPAFSAFRPLGRILRVPLLR